MALGTNHVTNSTQDVFLPEIWSDEIIGAFKSNLVVANQVTKISHSGKKGDTLHIPKGTRGAASAKAASTQVTLIADTETEVSVSINKHYEYSRLIEDITATQAIDSYRRFYTDDAGYSLAKQVDQDLHLLGAYLNAGVTTGNLGANTYETAVLGSDGSSSFSGAANTNTGNGAALADAGIRKMIQTLDDTDVSMDERCFIIPPVEKKNLLGLSRFTEQAFTGEASMGNSIRTGLIGDLYGIPVYVSTACPWIHVNSQTGTQSVTFSSAIPTGASNSDELAQVVDWNTSSPTSTDYRAGLLMHKSALVHVEQQGVRTQSQYKQEWLGDLFTADTLYGVAELRDDAALAFIVPA